MPYPYNIVALARVAKLRTGTDRVRAFLLQEKVLSKRLHRISTNETEIDTLTAFVDSAFANGIGRQLLQGFVFSYSIPQISKEFDLLKLADRLSVNIELKSKEIGFEERENQLKENEYYLRNPTKASARLFSYVAETGTLDEYREGKLRHVDWSELKKALGSTGDSLQIDYDSHFIPSQYLVSPINNTASFVSGLYFLTDQQRNIAKRIKDYYDDGEVGGFILNGGAGTGKSLLLYDMAKNIAKAKGSKSCIVHCAPFTPAHYQFNSLCSTIDLLPPKNIETRDLSGYCFIGVDEAHRIYKPNLFSIINHITESDKPFVVGIDPKQTLSQTEEARDIESELAQLIPTERILNLKGKIRSNKDIVNFVNAFFDNARKTKCNPSCMEISYVEGIEATKSEISAFEAEGYQYINISGSLYGKGLINDYCFGGMSTHQAIGQEFDKVVMAVPDVFHLEHGRIRADEHPYSDYLTEKLLYEGMTRARDRLALVFDRSWDMYIRALSLFE